MRETNDLRVRRSILLLIFVCALIIPVRAQQDRTDEPVYFPDAQLKACVEEHVGKKNPTATDMLSLTKLQANQRGIQQLTGLEYATNLETLSLMRNQLTNVRGLSGLPSLKWVDLQWNQIRDISALSDLPNLETVILHKNQLTAIPAFSGLPKLRSLTIPDNALTDIAGLATLPSLEHVSLINNKISVIPVLSGLRNLKRLSLNANQIADISALSGVTSLEHLELFSNQIMEVPPLTGLPNLKYLGLSKNRITSLSGLSGLTSLTRLEAWGNSIHDVSILARLTGLETLILSGNRISDISVLSGLIHLVEVHLDGNQITDIGSLTLLQSLNRVRLEGNPLDRNAYLHNLPTIRATHPNIYMNYDPCPWAFEGRPYDGALDAQQRPYLRWTAGVHATRHDVYFGDDKEAVANATTASTDLYRGRQARPDVEYIPNALERKKTYYWRVDEIDEAHPENPWEGEVWSFTTADFLVVDDFELYTGNEVAGQTIFQTWLDGYGFHYPGPSSRAGSEFPEPREPNYPGNGTGALVRRGRAPFVEQTIVHGGRQSMPFSYNNTRAPWYSETERTWATPQDWTIYGADTLTLYFLGQASNARDNFYVAVKDSEGEIVVLPHLNPDAVRTNDWQEWSIPLLVLSAAGVNVTSIQKMYVGVGDLGNPRPGGTGTVYIDDIRTIKSVP
jgi:Leucine-rich repeat (LRR) protein